MDGWINEKTVKQMEQWCNDGWMDGLTDGTYSLGDHNPE